MTSAESTQQSSNRFPQEQTERAILSTVLYADLFDYPLTVGEIAHYLGETIGGKEPVQAILSAPIRLNGQIAQVGEYITLRGREGLVKRRLARVRTSLRLWRKARFYGRVLSNLPFVRMLAVTGALAMDNSDERDDIDILMVTAPARVWLARLSAVLVVRAARFTATRLCPNYVLSQEVLALAPRTIYVAHEFAQMVPLFGFPVYAQMRAANPWAGQFLPNAGCPLHREPEYIPGRVSQALKTAGERLLSGRLGDWLEAWEMKRKIRKLTSTNALQGKNVILDRNHVKGHFDDHSLRTSSLYRRRVEEYQLGSDLLP
jgi:hypothetical protein